MKTRYMGKVTMFAFPFIVGCFLLSADDKKPAPKAAPAPRAPSAPASHPGGGGGGGSRGPSTSAPRGPSTSAPRGPSTSAPRGPSTSAPHGPTTSSPHGPTTTTHGPTTTSHGATTTSPRGATTTHSTTPSGNTPQHTTPGGTAGTPGRTGGATSTARTGTVGSPKGSPTGTHGWSSGKAPKGSTVATAKNGATVAKRPDGKVASLHDSRRGLDVHHGLNGSRRVVAERPDHSRVVVERGGRGYVQRSYSYGGREYVSRTYYYEGHVYNAYYANYYYHGVYVYPYYPSYYYAPAYYGWAYNPWVAPVSYAWGWGGNPWYGYYGAYFTPYPVYPSAAFWLTDYIISNSLAAAYQAQAAALANPAPLTPDVKQLISDEVKRQIALENAEAQTANPDAASSSIQRMLTDGTAHVFVAGADLDVVDSAGSECAISEGDALQLSGQTAPDATAANLVVLASKGGRECPKGDLVSIGFQDLQDMQNHMRQTIDQGMQDLQAKQGTGGLPAAPSAAKAAPKKTAYADAAPPPDQNVQAELTQEQQQADQAEKEAGETPPPIAPPSAPPAEIAVGQTIDQVTGALGQPKEIVNLGAKKIYIYKDMKITFKDGKVADVQ